jgi:hypothetical protein
MRRGCTITRREVANRRDIDRYLVLDVQQKVAGILHAPILIRHDKAGARFHLVAVDLHRN